MRGWNGDGHPPGLPLAMPWRPHHEQQHRSLISDKSPECEGSQLVVDTRIHRIAAGAYLAVMVLGCGEQVTSLHTTLIGAQRHLATYPDPDGPMSRRDALLWRRRLDSHPGHDDGDPAPPLTRSQKAARLEGRKRRMNHRGNYLADGVLRSFSREEVDSARERFYGDNENTAT